MAVATPLAAAPAPRAPATSQSRTTNFVSRARDATARKAQRQYASAVTSAVCPVCGSSRWTELPMRATSASRCGRRDASGAGSTTRSSRHSGTTSTSHECRTLDVPCFALAATTVSDVVTRHAASAFRWPTKVCAARVLVNVKSSPSRVRRTPAPAAQPLPPDHLLHREQRARVLGALAQLHLRRPQVLGRHLVAAVAIARAHDKLDDGALLQRRAAQHLLAHRQLHLEPPRVRLRPDPARVDEVEAAQPAHAAHAHREQLGRLGLVRHPLRVAVPLAARAAHLDLERRLDRRRDVGRDAQARHARAVGDGVGRRRRAAETAGY